MTHQYEEGIKLLEEKFGHFKDNVIALATTACDKTAEGHIQPVVREVDAFYEEGIFYVSTHEQSNKIKQIKKNQQFLLLSVVNGLPRSGKGKI